MIFYPLSTLESPATVLQEQGIIRVDAASYGVELGEYPGQKEDRRYLVEATIELGFDFSFGFLKGLGGDSSSSPRTRGGLERR